MQPRARTALVLIGAMAFGLLAGWLHGNDGGLRGSLGNVSAPWLFVALIPAWWAGSAWRGACVGGAATLIALLGFYLSLTGVMVGHLGTTHGSIDSFELVLRANRIWFAAGAISGPVCGALAGHLGTRARQPWLGALVGTLMIGEVAVVAGLQAAPGATLPVIRVGWAASDPRVYIPEAVLGGLMVLAAAWRARLAGPQASR